MHLGLLLVFFFAPAFCQSFMQICGFYCYFVPKSQKQKITYLLEKIYVNTFMQKWLDSIAISYQKQKITYLLEKIYMSTPLCKNDWILLKTYVKIFLRKY